MTDRARRGFRPRRHAVLAGTLAAVLAVGGSAVAGAADEAATSGVPDDTTQTTRPLTQAEVRPQLASLRHPLGAVADGTVPEPASVSDAISDELDTDWLGPKKRRSLTVRDALTGQVLVESNSSRALTPASTTKILSAAAIVGALPVEHTFATRVVSGQAPDEVVLVAGGDMLLSRGKGDPGAVAGHAGVGDLATQTAEALQAQGVTGPVAVRLDLQHVAGPHQLDTWSDFWVSEGYAGRIVQLGLAEDLALPFHPSPARPEQEVARAFVSALEEAGVQVAGWKGEDAAPKWSAETVRTAAGEDGEDGGTTGEEGGATGSEGAAEVLASVESAALRDVLALALAASDNAMVEQLARQAAHADGESTDRESVTRWIERSVIEDYGVDLTGLRLADASGLSDGTRLTVDAVADVLVAGADGSRPELQSVLAAGGLPIAGYTGTLSTRFHLPVHRAAVGNARAKTGSLPGVTSLAGTVVTRDGRLLVYSLTADDIGDDGAVLEARSSLDEVVAQLARCGC